METKKTTKRKVADKKNTAAKKVPAVRKKRASKKKETSNVVALDQTAALEARVAQLIGEKEALASDFVQMRNAYEARIRVLERAIVDSAVKAAMPPQPTRPKQPM